jgi:SAM-dependent methyltransferase
MVSNEDEYGTLAEFYDAIYAWRVEDIVFYLEEAVAFPGPVLEAGCGSGRITLPLAEILPEVFALDLSYSMLQILEGKRRQNARLHISTIHNDFRTFRTEVAFGQIFVPFRAFLHLPDQQAQLEALGNFRRHLRPDGRLIMDVFSPDFRILAQKQSHSELPEVWMKDGRLVRISDDSTFDHSRQWIYVNRHILTIHPEGKQENIHSEFILRYIFRYEMELLLLHAGFQLESIYGGFDRKPYGPQSKEMIFIARPNTSPV